MAKAKYRSVVFRMKGVRMVYDTKEWRKMLTSEEVTADLTARAERVMAAAEAASGGGLYVMRVNGRGAAAKRGAVKRSRVAVIAADGKAYRAEAKDQALTRAINAGRG